MGRKSRIRLRAIEVSFAAGVFLVLGRAAQIQLIEGAEHARTAAAERTERVRLAAPRGEVFDRNGVPLALTHSVYHVGVAPNELVDTAAVIAMLAEQLDLPVRTVRRELSERYGYFHGPYRSPMVKPLRGIRGVHLTSQPERFYPSPELARPILGRPAAPGRPSSGIERVFDSLLTGVDGSAVVLRDRSGRLYESPARLDAFPRPGHSIYLTIDAELQEIVEEALARGVDRLEAEGGDVIVVAPATGEVLAMASNRADGARTAGSLLSVFEPGSTAKLFAAAALLVHGLTTPDERVWTERGRWETAYRVIEDDHPNEWLTLSDIISRSSNIGIAKLAARLTPARQYEMLRDFGLGTASGIEYPIESRGILKRPDQWSGTTQAGLAMGYEVAVTSLQLAQAYATVANDGLMMRPTLVREIRSPDGETVYHHQPEPIRRVIPAEVARELRDMLVDVVYSGGTGETAALSSYEVAGKTGTARRTGPGGYIEGSYTASFASLFPADDPQIVMVVKIDDPRDVYARLTAAPVTKEVLERLLATQSTVLDRGRLTLAPPAAPREVGDFRATPPVVVSWPMDRHKATDTVRTVPDVSGMTLREAARLLHRAGFHVRVQGWGTVRESSPAAGEISSRGVVVTIVATTDPGVP